MVAGKWETRGRGELCRYQAIVPVAVDKVENANLAKVQVDRGMAKIRSRGNSFDTADRVSQ